MMDESSLAAPKSRNLIAKPSRKCNHYLLALSYSGANKHPYRVELPRPAAKRGERAGERGCLLVPFPLARAD
jgi:hypothetical protein